MQLEALADSSWWNTCRLLDICKQAFIKRKHKYTKHMHSLIQVKTRISSVDWCLHTRNTKVFTVCSRNSPLHFPFSQFSNDVDVCASNHACQLQLGVTLTVRNTCRKQFLGSKNQSPSFFGIKKKSVFRTYFLMKEWTTYRDFSSC